MKSLAPDKVMLPTTTNDRVEIISNWNSEIKGDFLKMRINNAQEIIIPRSSFSKVALLLASEEEQLAMIPTKSMRVRHLAKSVTIRLTRDMCKGTPITIPVSFDIPLDGELPVIQQ